MSGPVRIAPAVNEPFFPIELSWGVYVRDGQILDGQAVCVDWKISILIVYVASCGFRLPLLFLLGIPGCSNVLRCRWYGALRVAGLRFRALLRVLYLLYLSLSLSLFLLRLILILRLSLLLVSSRSD